MQADPHSDPDAIRAARQELDLVSTKFSFPPFVRMYWVGLVYL